MKKLILLSLFGAIISMAFYSKKSGLKYPKNFPEPSYNFEQNQLTYAKIELGRKLFYEPLLSKNNTISCASCHSPYNAFAHTDHDLSHGIHDSIGTRNAPALFNLAWQNSFMWDGAINHLDLQALAPLTHASEMAESLDSVLLKLNASADYKKAFYNAWNNSTIAGEHVLKSLAQFQLSLVSATAKYDRVKAGKVAFTKQEKAGYNLFKTNCNSCHQEPLFSNYTFTNNGLPIDKILNDYGKFALSGKQTDSLLFKIPSLRNLSFTFPYMHDGRFTKLSEVLNHYTGGIEQSSTLHSTLKNAIVLNANQKVDLTAFLLTLNDTAFVLNPTNKFPKPNTGYSSTNNFKTNQ